MKKIFTIFLAINALLSGLAKAQPGYNFSYNTGTYADLVSPTVIVGNSSFNGLYTSLPIGFNFHYWDSLYTSINVSTDAYFILGSGSYGFYPFYTFLKGLGNSSISYQLDNSGGAGNRILKIQLKNVGFSNDPLNRDSVSIQFWFYETSDKIEFHYGNNGLTTADFTNIFGSSSGPQVAFSSPSLSLFYNLKGNASSPMAVLHPYTFLYLTGYPPANTIYTFTPIGAPSFVKSENAENNILIFPNPARKTLNIKMDDAASSGNVVVSLINALGSKIRTQHYSAGNSKMALDIDGVPAGIYLVEICSGNKILHKNIVITN